MDIEKTVESGSSTKLCQNDFYENNGVRRMTKEKVHYKKFDHDMYARSKAADDYWGQIRRTVQGKPVTEDQIEMIVDSIFNYLELRSTDCLLDLACGNGALSHRLFNSCREYFGVDFSEYLISVAKTNFEHKPNYLYSMNDVQSYIRAEKQPERFTKVLCYGSFAYFPPEVAEETLKYLHNKFVNVERIFIGNLPDKEKANLFYNKTEPAVGELNDPCSQIGIWRSAKEFIGLASKAGWKVNIEYMSSKYYASQYRYDVLLSRK